MAGLPARPSPTNTASNMSTSTADTKPRRSRLLGATLLMAAALAAVVPAAPVEATEPPGPPPLAGVEFTDAWTNDDGSVDGVDTGDIGNVNGLFDAHGTRSSDDPAAEGTDPPRYDKDVARCTAAARAADAGFVDVALDNGYPGYVCTFVVTFTNLTGVPGSVAPAVIIFDEGLTVTDLTSPPIPSILGPGASATGTYAVRIEQSAPEDAVLELSIMLAITGEDPEECEPLDPGDIPDGAVLVNNSGLCTFFFDGNPGDCGPGWTEARPFAWHFVANKSRGLGTGELTAEFVTAGTVGPVDPTAVHRNNQHFFVYTASADTVQGSYVQFSGGAATRVGLVLSHTCNDPTTGGHSSGADLTLSASARPMGPDSGHMAVTLTLNNEGEADAAAVAVATTFPTGVMARQIAAPRGTEVGADGTWLVPHLGAGDELTLGVVVSVARAGTHTVTAEVMDAGALDADSTPGNHARGEDDYVSLLVSWTLPAADGGAAAAATLAALLLVAALQLVRRQPDAVER